jgi:phosphatidylglycerophosphate synthase
LLGAFVEPVVRVLTRWRVRPDTITLASLVVGFAAAAAFAAGSLAGAGALYLASGLLDAYDGRVARLAGATSASGALLDSVCDRYVELAVFGGLALHFDAPGARAIALAALSGSIMVSYARARGEALGARLDDVGFLQRPQRIVVAGVGALLTVALGEAALVVALVIIAVLGHITALARLRSALAALRLRSPAARPAASTTRPRGAADRRSTSPTGGAARSPRARRRAPRPARRGRPPRAGSPGARRDRPGP